MSDQLEMSGFVLLKGPRQILTNQRFVIDLLILNISKILLHRLRTKTLLKGVLDVWEIKEIPKMSKSVNTRICLGLTSFQDVKATQRIFASQQC